MAKRHWTTESQLAPDYGYYDWTYEDRLAYVWCVKNNIIVYPDHVPHSGPWKINIRINKKENKSPQAYGPDEILEKIFEFYRYYADKYRPEDELQ